MSLLREISAKIRNAIGDFINPATIEKQDDIISELQSIGSIDFATEAKQDNAISKLTDAVNLLTSVIQTNIHTSTEEVIVASKGHICADNSTATPLGINGVFTGAWQDTLDYSEVIISVFANQPSATDGLAIYWSADGINVHGDDFFTISASSGKTFSFPCQNRYVKIVYTNDGVTQDVFRLETILKRFSSKGSSHRLKDNLVQEDDAIVTKTQLVGFSTAGGGTLPNVKVNPSGALQVGGTIDEVLKSNSFLVDEFGTEHQMLGDNYFQGSPIVIDTDHHEIHCGDSLMTTRVVDLGNGAQDNILMITPTPSPSSKRYHLIWDISSEAEGDLLVYEDTVSSANGTPIASFNRNRQDPVASAEVAFYHTPTVAGGSEGTLIYSDHWGAGKTAGGQSRGQGEIILKNNAKYLFRITNSTTSANHFALKFNYYIHPGI